MTAPELITALEIEISVYKANQRLLELKINQQQEELDALRKFINSYGSAFDYSTGMSLE